MRGMFLSILMCAIGLLGCQKPNAQGGSAESPVPSLRTTSQNTDLNHIPPLACRDLQACPPAIGELISYVGARPTFCTVSLVAPDIVLTASHCVPWSNVEKDQSIRGNCWVRWPGKPDVKVECKEIIEASRLGSDGRKRIQLDHAFIRIANSLMIRPLAIDSIETRPSQFTEVYGTRLGFDAHTIEKRECARDDSFEVSMTNGTAGQMIVLPSCAVQPGFSGGPILNPQSHEIVGVVSGVIGYTSRSPDIPRPTIGTIVKQPVQIRK